MSESTRRIELVLSDGRRLSTEEPSGEITELEVIVGRGQDADLVIPDDTVSRRHFKVRSDAEGRWFISDLGSRSGTSINWMALDPAEEVRVRSGDRVRTGQTDVMLSFPGGDGPADQVAADRLEEPLADAPVDEFQTRGSLLIRLNAEGTDEREVGWQDFYDRYVPLITGFARRAGAKDEEAEDVAHEVMANFFRASERFEYNPDTGRFRGYLKAATLNAMRARWRKQRPMVDVDAGTDLPIEDRCDVDEAWDREWTRNLISRALATVRHSGKQSEQSWEAFELYGRRGVPIEEVSERLGMKPDAIRQAKSRIARQVRQEIERLRAEEG